MGGTPINSRIPKRVKNKPWQLWLELIRRTAEGIFNGFLILGGSLKFPNQGKVSELCRLHKDESPNPLRRMVHSLFLSPVDAFLSFGPQKGRFHHAFECFHFYRVWHSLTYIQTQSLEGGSPFLLSFPPLSPFDKVE